jgi:hypothetical protein
MAEKILKYNEKLLTWNRKYIRGYPPKSAYPWPTSGLIGRWRLESDLVDSINALDFSCTSGTEAYAVGLSGNALTWTDSAEFEADNATIFGNTFNGTHAYSLCFWYKMISVTDSIMIIMATDPGPWNVQTGSASIRAHSNSLNATEYGRKPGTEKYSDLTPDVNAWNNWIMTYDGSYTKLYLNNILIGTCNVDTNEAVGVRYLRINTTLAGCATACASGTIQNLYLYDKEISSDDRTTLYNSGTPI